MAHVTANLVWRRSEIDQAMNVLHFDIQGIVGPIAAQVLVDELAAAVATAFTGSDYRGRVASNWRLHRVQLRPGFDTSFPPVSSVVGTAGLLGTGSADAQSALIAVAVTLWASQGRPGRMFLPGWDEASSVANGRPSAGTSDAVVQFGERLKTNFDAIDVSGPSPVTWSVFRRQLDPPVGTRPSTDPIVAILRSSSSATAGWQTQRRRRFAIRAEE